MRTKVTSLSLEKFIDVVLLHDLKQMVETPCLHYLSFGNIAVGIEFLGSCLDNHEFDEKRQSGRRSRRGLREFLAKIDPTYSQYNDPHSPFDLWVALRCGMLHMLRPQRRVSFKSRVEARKDGTSHLNVDRRNGKRLILVAEDLYDDFETACKDLKHQLPDLSSKHPKLARPYLRIIKFGS